MKQPLTFLVLDLETTGLDEQADAIVEVAVVGLTADLQTELFAYSSPVDTLPAAIAAMPQAVVDMHTANGLLAEMSAGLAPSLTAVENALVALVDEHAHPDMPVYLSGSGVAHFDIRFIKAHMPVLAERLHYSIADIGIMRRFYQQITGADLTDANLRKTHRAMDDVRCHIEEARAFASLFRAHNLSASA